MKNIFCLIIVCYSVIISAQSTPPPPAIAKPEQQKLINEFLEISDYKEALLNYAKFYLELKMYNYETEIRTSNFTEKQANEILKQFDFESFKFSVQASLSLISVDKLKELVLFYKKIGGNLSKNHSVFLFTPTLRLNLENQMDYAISQLKN